jgi:hypothetical protein
MTLKLTFITAVAGAALLLALPAAHAAVSPDVADKIALRSAPEQWQQALQARSEALNQKHGLGGTAQGTVSTFEQALQARSEALNQKYGLGNTAQEQVWTSFENALQLRGEMLNKKYGIGGTAQGTVKTYEKALELRGEALNRQHGIGGPTRSAYFDAHERAARINGEPTTPSDAFTRAVGNGPSGIESTPVVSGDDHVRIAPADLPVVVATSSPSGTELEWPQIGVGFGIGMLLVVGIALTLRLTGTRRPLAH